jgi:hypothetical protein
MIIRGVIIFLKARETLLVTFSLPLLTCPEHCALRRDFCRPRFRKILLKRLSSELLCRNFQEIATWFLIKLEQMHLLTIFFFFTLFTVIM